MEILAPSTRSLCDNKSYQQKHILSWRDRPCSTHPGTQVLHLHNVTVKDFADNTPAGEEMDSLPAPRSEIGAEAFCLGLPSPLNQNVCCDTARILAGGMGKLENSLENHKDTQKARQAPPPQQVPGEP